MVSPSHAALGPKPCVSRVSDQRGWEPACGPLSMPLGRMDTRVWLFWKKGGEGASVLTVGTTLFSAPFPTVIPTDGLLHTHTCTHAHTQRPHAHTALHLQLCILAKDFL